MKPSLVSEMKLCACCGDIQWYNIWQKAYSMIVSISVLETFKMVMKAS